MKITKVTYQKTYSIGPYLTDRVGFEAELDGNDGVNLFPETPESALSQLKELADKWHKESNPHLYQESKPEPMYTVAGRPPIVHEPVQEINLQHDRVKILIENAESLWELHDIKKHHPVMPVPVLEFYKKRLKEFEDPTP
jgi:predicted RNase H-like HicB family nuclease